MRSNETDRTCLIVSLYSSADYEARIESRRHFWLRTEIERDERGNIWEVPKEHVDSIMSDLGIQVAWCKDYSVVQKCIAELRNRGHDAKFGRKLATYPI